MAAPPYSFSRLSEGPVSAYKVVVRLPDGLLRCYLPAFAQCSAEYARLQDYYGERFLSRVVPERYEGVSNVVKTKGCVEVRFIDFTDFPGSKRLFKVIFAFWQDFSALIKRRKTYQPIAAFKEISEFHSSLSVLQIPGLLPRITQILSRIRSEMKILVLIDPFETLFYRENDRKCDKNTNYDLKIAGNCYYFRKGSKRFLKTVRKHTRSEVKFYSCLKNRTLAAVCPAISRKIGYFGKKYCKKDEKGGYFKAVETVWDSDDLENQHFSVKNTVLIESDTQHSGLTATGVIVIPKFDGTEGDQGLKRVTRYVVEMLDDCDYDLPAYLSAHPFTP